MCPLRTKEEVEEILMLRSLYGMLGLLVCFKITEGHSFDVLEDKIQLPIRSENSVEISFGLSFIVLMKNMWYFPCILHQFWQKREKRVFFMEE